MIHAKTAVADGVWSRVGSSNLNLASLLSNWELDIAILDRSVGHEMEQLFLRDLGSSVEIGLPVSQAAQSSRRSLVRHPVEEVEDGSDLGAARAARRRARRGSRFGRMLSRISRASIVLSRALLGQRDVAREDRGWILSIAAVLLGSATLGFLFPKVLAWPIAFVVFWIGVASIYRASSAPPDD